MGVPLTNPHVTGKEAEAQKGEVTCPRWKDNKGSVLTSPLGQTG